ncbi:MAG: BrnT family toxin [Armatimonadetes bacterium]|nr:MAG: BrnT family toxin [Armatimonadota bacterium]
MPDLRIEWDENKNESNKRKHGVSFEEAHTVFFDDWAILIEDEDPNEPEE